MDGEVVRQGAASSEHIDLNFEKHLSKGHHKLEVIGGEDCCDGATKWQFKRGEGEWEDFTLRNLRSYCPTGPVYPETQSCMDGLLMEVSPLDTSGYLPRGKMVVWAMPMRKGQRLETWTTGQSDIDLYLRWNDCPTTELWDHRGYSTSGSEYEVLNGAPDDGVCYIGVRGYRASDYTLKTRCDGQEKMCMDV